MDLNATGLETGAAAVGSAGNTPVRNRAAERAQLALLAQEFEALLMNEMLGSWRESLMSSDESEESDHGMGTMVDMVGSEFGRALSKSGGLGIAAQLLKAFDRQLTAPADSPSTVSEPIDRRDVNPDALRRQAAQMMALPTAARAGQTAHTAAAPGPLVAVAGAAMAAFDAGVAPVNGTVTSGFGWRRDPLGSDVKFHAGADIRMAYGEEVTSVAAGRVSFAGEQGGYGLTVVVDHADGLQTRYAHLSSTSVNMGDRVSPGQLIARAGSSGRATGPHLHIELLSQGRPVDPSALLKAVTGSADWKAYRSASVGSAQDPNRGDQE